MALRKKVRVDQRFDDLFDGLLDDTVTRTGNTQFALGSVWFGNLNPFDGLGFVGSFKKFLP